MRCSRGGNVPVPGLTDREGWTKTLECLHALNLEPQEVTTIMRLFMAILHLGNLEITDSNTGEGIHALPHACIP